MKKGIKKIISSLFMSVVFVSLAQAEVVYQYNSSGQYGQTWGGSAGINVSVEGSGVNRSAHLVHRSYSPDSGYRFWYGDIPADAVKLTGVAGMSVQIDTCSVNPIAGCGYVDVTINTDEPASGWVYTGVNQYTWGDMLYQIVGNSQVRFSSATGSVNGIPVSETNAAIGKFNNVNVSVSVGK